MHNVLYETQAVLDRESMANQYSIKQASIIHRLIFGE